MLEKAIKIKDSYHLCYSTPNEGSKAAVLHATETIIEFLKHFVPNKEVNKHGKNEALLFSH